MKVVRLTMSMVAVAMCFNATAQDTVRTLDEVEVNSQRTPSTIVTSAPTQVVDAKRIEEKGAIQLSDALRDMAGITLKDYGGIGGMKTVSARGLGSQFSTLTIDGVAVDNSQNGQIDLGRYLVGNAAYIGLSQGQSQQSLLSARAYAAGNVISLESAEPTFFMAEKTNLKVGMDLGSFGLLSPTLLWERKWSRRLKSGLWVNYLKSDGDYPFTLYYTASHSDSSSRERREHSAMRMFTADGSLFYNIAKGNNITLKLHYMRGMHQLPGPVVYYTKKGTEQTQEESMFAQGRWKLERQGWKVQVLGKAQRNYDQYEDSASYNYKMNEYRQTEGYLSGSAEWNATGWLDLWGAVDGDLTRLASNLGQKNDVVRRNAVAVAGATAHNEWLELRANLLGTWTADHVADLDSTPTYSRLTPYAALMYKTPIEGLTARYFYKETFRVPTFSELYFFVATPHNLRPERAYQHNVGLSYLGEHVSGTLDAYHNHVKDKIVAVPTQNMFYWSMENLGVVDVMGVDFTADATLRPFVVHFNYSYAHAVDHSDPNSKVYGHQIRYTPRHSGGGSLRWENGWVNVGVSAMVVGERYFLKQNNEANRLAPYCDLGLTADHTFDLRWGTMRAQVQVANLLDEQYEIVQFYPMMGRNFKLSLMYEF